MKLYEIAGAPENQPLQGFSNTASIRASAWPYLKEKIDKLNKKAEKYGSPPIVLTQVKKYLKTTAGEKPEMWIDTKIEGNAPMIDGYKFVATIEHKDAGNIIRTAPDYVKTAEIENFYNANPDYCDECKKKRRRIDTFIVQDKDNHLRQIGKNCLSAFLGGKDPKAILQYFSLQDMANKAIDEAGKLTTALGPKPKDYHVTLTELLPVACAAVRLYGYRKTKNEYGDYNPDSTANIIRIYFFESHSYLNPTEEGWIKSVDTPTADDHDRANAILGWWSGIPQNEKDSSEFMHNLDVLVKGDAVSRRDVGFAVALIPTYARATAAMKPKPAAPTTTSTHVGTAGGKLPPTHVKVVSTKEISSIYGMTQLCRMVDDHGNTLVWFNSGSEKLEDGKEYTITGTIKKHDEFKGHKQTTLSRVKVV